MNFYDELIEKTTKVRDKLLYKNLLKRIDDYGKKIIDWDSSDLDAFLYSLHSTSLTSLQKQLYFIRQIHKYTCEKKNIEYTMLTVNKELFDYIDYKKLRSQIITYDDYKFIRNELDFLYDGEYRNVRDKVIFELAWEGLTASEIKNLKYNDIEFVENKIKLNLKNKTLWIHDPVVVQDIKKCMNEYDYYREDKRGKILIYSYVSTDNLIKPVAIRSDNKQDVIKNISITLKSIMLKTSLNVGRKSKDWDGTEHDLEIEHLTIENIRRSRIIYLISQKHLTIEMISKFFGKKTYLDFYWLKKVSERIYGKKE
jgi:site-specific recombinase XerD